jgi:MFS family permease
MITLITYGAGMFVGSFLSGWVVDRFATVAADGSATHQWRPIWVVSGALSAVVLLLFWFSFNEKERQAV